MKVDSMLTNSALYYEVLTGSVVWIKKKKCAFLHSLFYFVGFQVSIRIASLFPRGGGTPLYKLYRYVLL